MRAWQQDWIKKWDVYSPDKIAVKEFESGRTVTYRNIHQQAGQLAFLLMEKYNIKAGDRIGVLADFCIEYVILFNAAQKAGFILIPLNYRLAGQELKYIIEDAIPAIIISEDKYNHLLSSIPNTNQISLEFINQTSVISDGSDYEFDYKAQDDDSVFILYTSGTTGNPKGVKYTHKMLFWNSINTSMSLLLNTESRTVNVMPPFHTGGWNVLLTPFLHHGAYVCICKKFDPSVTLNLIGSEKATIFMGVPTMLLMMAEEVDFKNTDFSDLLYMIVGGEAMPVPLIEKYHQKGVAIRQGYGMTEVGPNLTSLHQNDAIRKIGSIGRPNFYVNIKVVTENGSDALPNEPGELWLSGPMVTPGYWNNDAITASAFSEDGIWFKTGDIVIETEDNYIYVVDRLKNMYISGGENVYPAEIEKVLNQIPEILECTVIGVKDEKWGEVGKAYIVWQNQKQVFDESFLKNYCQSKLAKFKVPKYFATLEALPKTDSGKTDKKKLKILHDQSATRD